MTRAEIVKQTEAYIKKEFAGGRAAHDWYHIKRVYQQALAIAKQEGGDVFIIKMAALLHDLDDFKFSRQPEKLPKTKKWLNHFPQLSAAEIKQIVDIVKNVSFKGGQVKDRMSSKEGKIVRDADRLDSIGAIAIARIFTYGGAKNRAIHDPEQKPQIHRSFQAYKSNKSTSLNHFYEKALLLKDRLQTNTARRIAQSRHAFMQEYLKHFLAEWSGKK